MKILRRSFCKGLGAVAALGAGAAVGQRETNASQEETHGDSGDHQYRMEMRHIMPYAHGTWVLGNDMDGYTEQGVKYACYPWEWEIHVWHRESTSHVHGKGCHVETEWVWSSLQLTEGRFLEAKEIERNMRGDRQLMSDLTCGPHGDDSWTSHSNLDEWPRGILKKGHNVPVFVVPDKYLPKMEGEEYIWDYRDARRKEESANPHLWDGMKLPDTRIFWATEAISWATKWEFRLSSIEYSGLTTPSKSEWEIYSPSSAVRQENENKEVWI